MSPGESSDVALLLPPGQCCIERWFEVYSGDPWNTRYSWVIDDRLSVDLHRVIPNSGSVERAPFAGKWVKERELVLHYENLNTVDEVPFVVRAWARLMEKDKFKKHIEPILRDIWEAEIKGPEAGMVAVVKDPKYRCPKCGAEAEVDFARRSRRVKVPGGWGGRRGRHACPLLNLPLSEGRWAEAVREGLIEEVR